MTSPPGDRDPSGPAGFAAWAGAGFLLAAATVSIASVGLLALPVAVVALALVVRRWPSAAASTGLLSGSGLAAVGVALLNAGGSGRCSGDGSCGLDPLPWAVAGAVLVVAGVAAYVELRR